MAISTKDEIVQSINYLEYYKTELGQLLKPDRRGWATALCPFHEDTKPSLGIDVHTGIFNCPGCGAKGDVISFYKKKHGCDFKTAIIELGIIAGVRGTQTIPGKQKGKRSGSNQPTQKAKITTVYDYHAADGSLLFQVCRFSPKDFRQRRPNGQGGHIWNLQGITPVLYHLPQVLAADQVIVVEGEKDVDNLSALQDIGVVATTCPMGAGKWRKFYTEALRGKNIIVIPDNDEPGQKHAVQVATALYGVAKSIKVVELPGLPKGGDVSDFIARHNDPLVAVSTLMALVEKAPVWMPGTAKPTDDENINFADRPHFTDMGNAFRLAHFCGENIRYSHEEKGWYVWNGDRWMQDNTGKIKCLAKKMVKLLYKEAAGLHDDDAWKALVNHALKSESDNRIKAMMSLAESEPGIPVLLNQFNTDLFLLNCQNGTLDLRTGKLKKHDPKDLITKITPVIYNSEARDEKWERFLEQTIPDADVRSFVQRFSGYSITGDISEEKMAFMYGPPATGKSTFLRAIAAALGDYAAFADFEAFLQKSQTGGAKNDIARLVGKRLVIGIEVEEGKKLAEGLVNQLTGGDVIAARFLHKEFFEFVPQLKLWLAANNQPRITGIDGAIWRRILQIPFDQQISEQKRDIHLKNILCNIKKTGPAVLSWLVQGCLAWQKEGLRPPDVVKQATNEYKQKMDPLADFMQDMIILQETAYVKNSELWAAYISWCNANGEKYPIGRKKLTQLLIAKGFNQYRSGKERMWMGIELILEEKYVQSY